MAKKLRKGNAPELRFSAPGRNFALVGNLGLLEYGRIVTHVRETITHSRGKEAEAAAKCKSMR